MSVTKKREVKYLKIKDGVRKERWNILSSVSAMYLYSNHIGWLNCYSVVINMIVDDI